MAKVLQEKYRIDLFEVLKLRFESNMERHSNLDWDLVSKKLDSSPEKLWSLVQMEATGGEPDVVRYDEALDLFTFYDCSKESPTGRRSVCYDEVALNSRKKHKPETSAGALAEKIGVSILTEEEYRYLQSLGEFDLKTSSWIKTNDDIRNLGGAIFADRRYNQVFIYHNGAESYYSARGFRGSLKV